MTRDGKTALQHISSNPTTVQIEGTNIAYHFVPKHNVCLAWVGEEYVEKVLSIKTKACDCNGGLMKPKFFIASDINVSIFETGNYPQTA